MSGRPAKALFAARIQPISPAFPPMSLAALKAAAPDRALQPRVLPLPATFPPAHALVIRLLPSRKQWPQCLRIKHDVALSWSTCIRYGHQQYLAL